MDLRRIRCYICPDAPPNQIYGISPYNLPPEVKRYWRRIKHTDLPISRQELEETIIRAIKQGGHDEEQSYYILWNGEPIKE